MKFLGSTITEKSFSCLLLFLSIQTAIAQAAVAINPASPQRVSATSETQAGAICPAQLGGAIDRVIERPQFAHARWGVVIQSLSSANTLYARDRTRYFIPASNTKLLTTAAALRQLGSQFRIRTSVYSLGNTPNSTALRVVGRGDPSLKDAQLQDLAQQLKRQGYQQIQQLVVDDGYFQEPSVNSGWEWGDLQSDYGAPVNSLILNQNAIGLTLTPQTLGRPLQLSWTDPLGVLGWQIDNHTVTTSAASPASVGVMGVVGKPILRVTGQLPIDAKPNTVSLAVFDPAESFSRHFQQALGLQQIQVVTAKQISNGEVGNERELAAVESPPLAALLMETNQNSNNLYAEALLRSLIPSNQQSTTKNQHSLEMGLAAVKQSLTELGVDPQSYVLADGSGLSRHNLVSPDAIAQTLQAMAKTPVADVYRASLPVAGVSGTLKTRFLNTPAQGIFQGKTGTMSGVVALSGYLNSPTYQPLVVSILVNQSEQPASTIRQAMDEIVVLLTRLRTC
jgi:D-alanyl-D-alanine carboxypeptidase/D-alanyl-D-alanine-endopeptidase (penicillin-binding protein 4)